MSSSSGRLLVDEPAPGVARLTISNPAKRGALDRLILDALAQTLPGLEARCLILTGEGTVFSAGYDVANLDDGGVSERADELVANPFDVALHALDEHPWPIVAALNGHAIGGGLELALACDLRLAAEPATFGMPPARLG
ncbi:MAG: enoyl-CoA hydratase/isomerase family protein, partial [Solirubrobacteraceae bacterium]